MKEITNDLDLITDIMKISGKRIIDVGCSTGELVRQLTEKSATVMGIDSPSLIEKALKFPRIKDEVYLAGSGENFPFKNEYADLIVFFASLHHVPPTSMHQALEETHRVLKTGGTAIFLEPVPQKGSYFELIRLVDDETQILNLADKTIKQVYGTLFQPIKEELVYFPRSFQDFQTLLEKYVENKVERKTYFTHGKEVANRMSREAGINIEEYRFKSIANFTVLKKISDLRSGEKIPLTWFNQ